MRTPYKSRSSVPHAATLAGVLLAASVSAQLLAAPADALTVGADHAAILYSGRTAGIGTKNVIFGWSGSRIRLRFEGSSSVGIYLDDDSGNNYAMTWIDGAPGKKFRLDAADGYYPLADGLDAGQHTVEVVRVTECFLGLTHFRGFVLHHGATPLPWGDTTQRRIEFIGDSITCAYGVEVDDPGLHFDPATENFCLGYAGLTARALDADYLVVARSGIGMVRNYDGPRNGNGEAMPQLYRHTFNERPETNWDFRRFTPDVVCLNLGTNDFSTSGVNVDKFVATYAKFLNTLLTRYPQAKLVVLQGPMDNSKDLRDALNKAIGRLSGKAANRIHFLALSPQGNVGFGADYHPNHSQSKINATELTAFLAEPMGWRLSGFLPVPEDPMRSSS